MLKAQQNFVDKMRQKKYKQLVEAEKNETVGFTKSVPSGISHEFMLQVAGIDSSGRYTGRASDQIGAQDGEIDSWMR